MIKILDICNYEIALLTSGGIAPCLSASVGKLIDIYFEKYPNIEIIGYLNGYKGLLLGKSVKIPFQLKIKLQTFTILEEVLLVIVG